MEKISVIVPVYQAEQYLVQCIGSILKQSYFNIELILVDDGSTDRSGAICDSYCQKQNRVRVIHTENQGPAAARRTGIEAATGTYIMFVDADDWIDQEMVKEMYRVAQQEQAKFVSSSCRLVNHKGEGNKVYYYQGTSIICRNPEEAMFQIHGTRYLLSGPWAKLIKRELFTGIDFYEGVTIGEDYGMILQLLEKSSCTVILGQAFYNRCLRNTSISRSGYTERHKHALEHYLLIRENLLKKYPHIRREILGYHMEYEMAVITAMCRNNCFDKPVIIQLKQDIRMNWKTVIGIKELPLSIKGSMLLVAYACPIFIMAFSLLHKLTGR